MSVQSKRAFLKWAWEKHPQLMRAAVKRVRGMSMSGMGLTSDEMIASQNAFAETSTTVAPVAWEDRIFSFFEKVSPAIVGTMQAKEVMKINLERAKLGLPPIDTTQASPQFNVGIPKDVQMIMWAGIGLLGIFLIAKARK